LHAAVMTDLAVVLGCVKSVGVEFKVDAGITPPSGGG